MRDEFSVIRKRFDAVDQRFDSVDQRFVSIDYSFDETRRHARALHDDVLIKLAEATTTLQESHEQTRRDTRTA